MRTPRSVSLARAASIVAVPVALALVAQPASAQWHAQQQQQQQYPQQQYPQQQRYPQRSRQASAGPREIFEWQGMVDKEIRVQMNGGRTGVMAIGDREGSLNRPRAMSSIPAMDGYVTVQELQGRGRVDVVQQPSAQNGYTAIIRVRDPQSGASPYRIAAYWQPTGNSAVYGNQGYGNQGYGNQGYDNGNHKDRGRHRGRGDHDGYDRD